MEKDIAHLICFDCRKNFVDNIKSIYKCIFCYSGNVSTRKKLISLHHKRIENIKDNKSIKREARKRIGNDTKF